MKSTSQLKAGAVLSYLSMFIGYAVSILYTPVMLRLLGQSEYGLYNLVASVVSYLGLLSFGFGSAYVRYYSRYKVKDDEYSIAKLNGMFLIVFSLIGLIAVLAGSVLVFHVDLLFGEKLTVSELAKAKVLMAIMVLNMALSFPASVFNSYITANEEYVFQQLLQIMKTVVHPFVMLPVLLLGYKSIGMVVVTTILTISVEIANVVFCFRKLKMRFLFRRFDFSLMKEMTVFSSYIFLNMIIDQINWNVDKFIIGRFRGTVEVAVYGLAAQLNSYYMSLAMAVSYVFIPRINRMVAEVHDNGQLTNLFTRVGRIQFILLSLVCSGFIFFGRPFLRMWAGNNYGGTYPITLILIVPVTFPLVQTIGLEIQKAKNMHKFRSWVYLFIAVGNVFLSIPLTKAYGGIGAALGTAVSLLIGNVLIMNWYYNARVGLDIKYFWNHLFKLVPALVLPAVAGILIRNHVDLNNVVYFLVFGVVYVFIYFVSMWFLGMNQEEKDLIGKPAIKILSRWMA